MFNKNTKQAGFTLIELLVVVAIVSLLSSIIFANLRHARMRAEDIKKIVELRQVSNALQLYYNEYGAYPNQGTNVLTNQWSDNFNSMASQLVTAGFLSAIPVSPNSTNPELYNGFNYYNYGPGTAGGALMVTILSAVPDTTNGISPSCRPFVGVINWCTNDLATKEYCLCHPH